MFGVKAGMLKGIVAPTVLYGSETLMLNSKERRILGASDMKCFGKAVRVDVMYRMKSRDIKKYVDKGGVC